MLERAFVVNGQDDGASIQAVVSISGEMLYEANLKLTRQGNFTTNQLSRGKVRG